jgi:hypothetical protein
MAVSEGGLLFSGAALYRALARAPSAGYHKLAGAFLFLRDLASAGGVRFPEV